MFLCERVDARPVTLDGWLGIVGLVVYLLVLAVLSLLVVFGVAFVGAGLAAAVTLPLLSVLPVVRRGFLALTERLTGRRPASVTERRFLAVYAGCIVLYGGLIVALPALVAAAAADYGVLVPRGTPPWVAIGAVVLALCVVGIAAVAGGVATRGRLRAVGEWALFACLVTAAFLGGGVGVYLLATAVA